MKHKKHLEFYKKNLELSTIPYHEGGGLCGCAEVGLIDKKLLEIFEPSHEEFKILFSQRLVPYIGLDNFWAAGIDVDEIGRNIKFTHLRQTIVLLMAAINNEL